LDQNPGRPGLQHRTIQVTEPPALRYFTRCEAHSHENEPVVFSGFITKPLSTRFCGYPFFQCPPAAAYF
jgi:hypothetical protein